MIKSELIAKKIYKQVERWKKTHAKLVVAIDGYAGSGKTTIGEFIARHDSDVLLVHLDDFIKHWKVRKKMIAQANDKPKVFEHRWYRYHDVERLVKAFLQSKASISLKKYDYNRNGFAPKKKIDLSRRVLIIDGIFLIHPRHKLDKLIDKKIYLDVDFTKADKKRVLREKKKWGKKYLSEDHPENWTRYFKVAYKNYVRKYQPSKRADVTFKI